MMKIQPKSGAAASFTSPRVRGEVEIRVSEFRVRGAIRAFGLAVSPPHPNPLPASGARGRTGVSFGQGG